MSIHRSLAICRHEIRVLRGDPFPVIVLFVMPLVLMAFVKPQLRFVLEHEGFEGANGAEQAVPGMAVLFSLFLVTFVALPFLDEHSWGTWDRLRASWATHLEIIIGKAAPRLALAVLQQALLFAVGLALLDLRVAGSLVALSLVASALAFCLVALGLAVVAVARTVQQVIAIGNVGAIVFGGIGGALAPTSILPGWIGAVAPATPTYWAMRGYRSIILEGGGLYEAFVSASVMVGFGLAFGALAFARLRFEDTKVGAL